MSRAILNLIVLCSIFVIDIPNFAQTLCVV